MIDNRNKLKRELEDREEKFLTLAGELIGNAAKSNITHVGAVDTGALRNSIRSVVKDKTVVTGSDKEYAPYIEYGTGAGNIPGGSTKPHWVYYNQADGQFHVAYPQPPRPWMKPALYDNVEALKKLFEDVLRRG